MAGLLQHRLPGACLNVPSTNSRPPQRMARCTCAAAADDTDPPPQPKRNKLPGKGFFAEADTEGADSACARILLLYAPLQLALPAMHPLFRSEEIFPCCKLQRWCTRH